MRLKYFLSEFFLSLVNVRIQFVSVLSDGELMIVIHGNIYGLFATGLVFLAMELSYVRVLQSFDCGQTFAGIKLQQSFQQIQSLIACSREQFMQGLCFSCRQRLKHSGCKGRLNSLNVFGQRSPRNLHNSV